MDSGEKIYYFDQELFISDKRIAFKDKVYPLDKVVKVEKHTERKKLINIHWALWAVYSFIAIWLSIYLFAFLVILSIVAELLHEKRHTIEIAIAGIYYGIFVECHNDEKKANEIFDSVNKAITGERFNYRVE